MPAPEPADASVAGMLLEEAAVSAPEPTGASAKGVPQVAASLAGCMAC